MSLTRKDLERARRDPALLFEAPDEIVRRRDLPRDLKLELLERWEFQARQLQRASDENMAGGQPPRLGEVLEALRQLKKSPEPGSD